MKYFDVERAKAGDPVVDDNGNDVTILMFDFRWNDGWVIVAVTHRKNEDALFCYNNKGEGMYSMSSLKMKPIKVERWVNVYKSDNRTYYTGTCSETEDQAVSGSAGGCIKTVKIEWEE